MQILSGVCSFAFCQPVFSKGMAEQIYSPLVVVPRPKPITERAADDSFQQGIKADGGLHYIQYKSSHETIYLSAIRQLISTDLSEPYSIYVYRYFLYQWGDLCFMVCMIPRIIFFKPPLIRLKCYVTMLILTALGILFQALDSDEEDNLLGIVISKLEPHRGGLLRGYIAMLAVKEEHRGRGIGTRLVRMAIDHMIERNAEEVCPNLHNSIPRSTLVTV